MSAETWRPVPGYANAYEVSDLGRVRSIDRIIVNSAGVRKRLQGRVLKLHLNSVGYWSVHLHSRGRQRTAAVHQVVAAAFHGPRPEGWETLHRNGDYLDNRAGNLRWGSKGENAQDSIMHGTNRQARKTHCPRLHPLEAPNLLSCPPGKKWRVCLACSRANSQRNKMRRRGGLVPDLKPLADAYYAEIMAGREPLRVRLADRLVAS